MNTKTSIKDIKASYLRLATVGYVLTIIVITVFLTVRGISLAGKFHNEYMEQAHKRSQASLKILEKMGLEPRIDEESDGIEFFLGYHDSEEYEYAPYYQDILPLIKQNYLPDTAISYSEKFILYGTDTNLGGVSIKCVDINKDDGEYFYRLLNHLNDVYGCKVIEKDLFDQIIQEYIEKQRDRKIAFEVDKYEVIYRMEGYKNHEFSISISKKIDY